MNLANVPKEPGGGAFKIARLYKQCTDPNKVDLGIGAYRDDQGQPFVLKAVTKAKVKYIYSFVQPL